jgi:hypothetical protein
LRPAGKAGGEHFAASLVFLSDKLQPVEKAPMPGISDSRQLQDRLADLSRRIEARSQQLRDNGEFSDSHERLLADIRRDHTRLQAKVDEAAQKGTWDLLKAELSLDYDAIMDSLRSWQDRLDAEENKQRR